MPEFLAKWYICLIVALQGNNNLARQKHPYKCPFNACLQRVFLRITMQHQNNTLQGEYAEQP